MFIGYPRSGHSLIGSLLDAHPNVIISHQTNALKLLTRDLSRLALFREIYKRSKNHARQGRKVKYYSYKVKNQYQGKFTDLKVIGDKMGGQNSLILAEDPYAIDKLQNLVNNPIRIIHVTRNPFDCISTSLLRRHQNRNLSLNEYRLKQEINEFFLKANSVLQVKNRGKYPIFDLAHDDFMKNSGKKLIELCHYLSIEPHSKYVEDCCNIVIRKSHKSRFNIDVWTSKLIMETEMRMREFPFLMRYNFNN